MNVYMSQQTQLEIDEAEAAELRGNEEVDVGGYSMHDGFTESLDDSTRTDMSQPTNIFHLSERELRHQIHTRTQE